MYKNKSSLRIGLYEKALPNELTWQEKLTNTKMLGFDFLEISIDESEDKRQRLDWSNANIYEQRHLCEDLGIPLQSMCLSAHRLFPFGSSDPKTVEQDKSIMAKAITLAYKLGIRTIQLAGYDVYYETASPETDRRFIEGMQWSAKLAEQAGVILAVEIMDTNYLNSLTKFEILKQAIPSSFFMAYPDVGNITGWNYDVCSELAMSRHHIAQIHLKDTYRVRSDYGGQFRDLVIGEGDVNFTAIFATLKKISYSAPLVIEMWAKDQHWRANIEQAKCYLQQAAAKSAIKIF